MSLGIWSRLATEFDESGKGNAGAQTQGRNITIEIGGKIQLQRVNSRKLDNARSFDNRNKGKV